MKNFAIIGVGGYIAPRHLKAIKDTGNIIVAATDPKDSVGILDRFSYDVRYFPEIERFDRHLEKLRHKSEEERVHFVSVCSPNYLHDAHCRLAMRVGANVICEKPLVINPWNLEALQEVEEETNTKINTVLQLRVHPSLIALKERIEKESPNQYHDVNLTYITSRGNWYLHSWKGNLEKSGGITTNIGIHFFDLLIWLFGEVVEKKVYLSEIGRMMGVLMLERARVRWYLSLDKGDLPFKAVPGGQCTYRSITIDGNEIEFSNGFNDLHTKVYQRTLTGNGFTIEDAKPSINLTHQIRTSEISEFDEFIHPYYRKLSN